MNFFKIKSFSGLVLMVLLGLTLLVGCRGQQLSSDFDENEVKQAAENVIALINKQDSEGLRERCTVEMRQALTDDVLQQMYEVIEEGGAFEGIEDVRVTGMTDKASQEQFAVAAAKAKYEAKKFTFTITFDKQMKLAGLYYK